MIDDKPLANHVAPDVAFLEIRITQETATTHRTKTIP